jgi:hypothetical protein
VTRNHDAGVVDQDRDIEAELSDRTRDLLDLLRAMNACVRRVGDKLGDARLCDRE